MLSSVLYLTLNVRMVFTTTGVRAMKRLLARTFVLIFALGASLLAIAQSLPVFGTA